MSATVEEAAPEDAGGEAVLVENRNLLTKIATTVGLGVLAVVGYEAERRGITAEIPTAPKMIVDSFKHPVVGYLSAWVGSKLARKFAPDYEAPIVAASATVGNFSAELGQSNTIADEEHKNFLAYSQLFETMKDYVFALGGCALFMFQNRRTKEPN